MLLDDVLSDHLRRSLTLIKMLYVFGQCWLMPDDARGRLILVKMMDVLGQYWNSLATMSKKITLVSFSLASSPSSKNHCCCLLICL